ncbi:hypothetical protein JTE90_014015 [Oedothorax gibbosus]|uniref:Uncharacterized protein n=1 Tax=Oedothorax gibbosus TaxID=931172 RepID=A0AAV6U4N5_9ARAC|nr:hypothetical protein JTE90_014015 [Oedothorax gibbosus]
MDCESEGVSKKSKGGGDSIWSRRNYSIHSEKYHTKLISCFSSKHIFSILSNLYFSNLRDTMPNLATPALFLRSPQSIIPLSQSLTSSHLAHPRLSVYAKRRALRLVQS